METYDPGELLKAFRAYCCEPPVGYKWSVEHGLFGFSEFTQFEPWFFCGLNEIRPLKMRWAQFKSDSEFIPFARRQDGDNLACFRIENGQTVEICIIHYNLGPPLSWDITDKYHSFWDWLKGIIADVEVWCGIQSKLHRTR